MPELDLDAIERHANDTPINWHRGHGIVDCQACQARDERLALLAEVRRLRAAAVYAPVLGLATNGPAGDREAFDGATVAHRAMANLGMSDALDATAPGTRMAAASVDPDGTARVELIERTADGWWNHTTEAATTSAAVARACDDVVVCSLPEPTEGGA